MFDVTCSAEIRAVTIRTETVAHETVPALDIKMLLLHVPVERISSACPEIGERFYEGDMVAVGEVNPLTVGHKLENLSVKIGDKTITGCDIKKGAKITLLPEKLANVEVTIQTLNHKDLILKVIGFLKSEIGVTINERQLKMVEMNQ